MKETLHLNYSMKFEYFCDRQRVGGKKKRMEGTFNKNGC